MNTTTAEEQVQTSGLIPNFIYSAQRWKLIAFLMIANLLKSGIWFIPNLFASKLVAQNPFVNPFPNWPEAHYIYWSWLAPFLAWCIGATKSWSFFAFHFAFSVAFSAFFIALILSRFPDREARTALVLFTVLPVSATPYFWVSMDSVTLFLMVCALAVRKLWPLIFLIGIALGMQHFEQSFCAVAALTAALVLGNYFKSSIEYSMKWALFLMGGIVCGKLLLFALFMHWHVEVNSGRLFWLVENFRELVGEFYYHFQYAIYSVFGVGWLFVLKCAEQGRKSLPLFVAICCVLLLLPISADQTRVTAIVSFLSISVFCLLNRSFLVSLDPRFSSWILLTWLVVPYAWVWKGNPKWSALPYDVALPLHKLFGWFSMSSNKAVWPFE
jgi:hypothetical protein